MKFAYADPPYLGMAAKFYGHLHPNAADFDKLETHAHLINRMCDEFSDGWALSLSSTTLKDILPLCPRNVRVAAWVKPFASFKPGVSPCYAWEPVIFYGGRRSTREERSGRDFVAANMTLKRGFAGAKPEAFVHWILDDLFHANESDEIFDLFPGSGAVQRAIESWRNRAPLVLEDAHD